jgi:hypothetical protein
MRRRSLMVGLVGLLLMLLVSGAAIAQSSAHFDVSWNVLAGGGGHSASSQYAFDATLGQAVAGPASGGSTELLAGYWQAFPAYKIYLPLMLRNSL